MTLDLLTRPPSGIIPPPPPREPRREVFIIPDVAYGGDPKRIYDHKNNWITIHWWMMNRVHGFFEKIEMATVHCRRYKAWLDVYEMKDGIPPHIQFGGAIVAGKGDPTFHDRWKAYARETFC